MPPGRLFYKAVQMVNGGVLLLQVQHAVVPEGCLQGKTTMFYMDIKVAR